MQDKITSILQKYPNASRDALIPILQDVQEKQGFLSKESIRQIGSHLSLPVSKIYGVATFYNQFRFEPVGKYHVQICRGTACHVKGSAKLLEIISKELDIKPGQTSRDGLFSIEVVACIGACGLAPVIAVNGEFHAGVTLDAAVEILNQYRRGEESNGT